MKQSLSIIIPCYNEYKRLYTNLPKLLEFLEDISEYLIKYELIFVNDGSTDNTLRLLGSIPNTHIKIVHYEENKGKGYAVREGLKQAKYDLILFMDADLATDLYNIIDALKLATRVDLLSEKFIIIGNRELPTSHVNATYFRKTIGRKFNLIQRIVLGIPVRDTQCGFKMFNRAALNYLLPQLKMNGFAFDVEILYLCKEGVLIHSMPVIWNDVAGSKVHPLRDSYRMFKDLMMIKRLHGQ